MRPSGRIAEPTWSEVQAGLAGTDAWASDVLTLEAALPPDVLAMRVLAEVPPGLAVRLGMERSSVLRSSRRAQTGRVPVDSRVSSRTFVSGPPRYARPSRRSG